MRLVLIVLASVVTIGVTASAAGRSCCGGDKCCPTAKCCATEITQIPPSSFNEWPTGVREYAKVTFRSPVRVGEMVLMGQYIIEHDTDRMARGGPCTHIYSVKDRRSPIVTFHCRHLTRPSGDRAKVTLRRDPALPGQGFLLTEFQFANSTEAHGVPGIR